MTVTYGKILLQGNQVTLTGTTKYMCVCVCVCVCVYYIYRLDTEVHKTRFVPHDKYGTSCNIFALFY